ncbi:replication protein A 70 kDa DNA-binding subunit [Thrips palmi]|uniref:Replication protein A subunit n=1 Tax=Thrips palmi TaxID=161013 RepID=A0A6P8YPG8_THRPL|nr:replication protein A 70 kDa DNA-binding subunit [Thrips palmi]
MDLSEGALDTIMNGGQIDEPIMQILGSKKISGAGDNERYRLLVSDGVHVNSFAMLATQLNDKIRNGDLGDNTIVRIKRYITSVVPNSGKGEKRVMIILDVEVVSPGSEVGCRIGNPVSWSPEGQAQPPAAAAAPAAAAPPSRPVNGQASSSNSAAPAPAPKPAFSTPPKAPAAVNGGNRGGFGGGYGNNIRSPGHGMGGMELTPNTHSHPIASLTPYQNKWVIKARVTSKGPKRSWSNAKGEGSLFSFDLVDDSGEIRVTAFREQCTKFHDMIEVGKVYLITKGTLKTANKMYSNLNNDYELNLNNESQILPVPEDDDGVPQIKFNFVPLDQIEIIEPNMLVDVIGVVKTPGEVTTFTSKSTNKEFKKREVTIVDKTNTAIHLTLWGSQAEEFDGSNQPVVAVKGGKVNEFGGGKSVSLPASATFLENPDIPEAHQLKGWYDGDGSSANFKLLSQRTGGTGMGSDADLITIKEARDKGLGSGGKTEYYSTKASIVMIKSENAMYNACPGENCNKKVIDQQNGLYRCEKCNRDYPNYKPRLLLSMNVGDWSDNTWVTLFQEQAEEVLGQTSASLDELKTSNPEAYQQIFQQATFKSYVFRMRVQLQAYNDETRLKTNVYSVKKIDHKSYCESLLSQLKEIEGMGEA